MNKSIYIANRTYILLKKNVIKFVKSVKLLNVKLLHSVECTLISFNITLLSTVYRNDRLKLTFNCFFAIQSENY